MTIDAAQVLTTGNAVAQLGSQFLARSDAGVNLGSNTALRTLAAGSPRPAQIVLGTYNHLNDPAEPGVDHTEGVLIVGSGNPNGPRGNGLRILADGSVLIQPAGELEMAVEFRAGPTP